jgi:OmcA/MtrC family decaheme c-type cytochrome
MNLDGAPSSRSTNLNTYREVTMIPAFIVRRSSYWLWPAVFLLAVVQNAIAQTPPPAWSLAPQFRYNIENIVVNTTAPGTWNVRVIFSVSNPTTGDVWDIKTALPYQSPGAALTMLIGWDPSTDFTNTGSAGPLANPVVATTLGAGAAIPIQIRNLNGAPGANRCTTTTDCPGVADLFNRFWVEKSVTPVTFMRAVTKGRIGMEGHPVCNGLLGCPAPVFLAGSTSPTYANIPVRSEVADFAFLGTATPTAALVGDQRRQVVDFATKCNVCHSGTVVNNGTPIPRLSLHGNQRNENPKLCVMCHNPNQTDVPYRVATVGTALDPRISGPEVSLDFKRMVHSIHAGGFRRTPFVVIGFQSSVNDFSGVRFPGQLRNCVTCHIDNNGKGTFELPLQASVLGSTVTTNSAFAVTAPLIRTINVNPFDDLKITPTAAACSGCHDSSEVRSHMIRTGGASFSTLQQNIGTTVNERCASCHGPGKEEDVRRAHEIRRAGGGGRG